MTAPATVRVLFPPEAASTINAAFERLGVAEEMIAAAFPGHPPSKQNRRAFMASCPSVPLRDKDLALYRAHVAEIIDRVARNVSVADLALATDAEIIAVLSDTSLKAPLNRTAQAIYEHLFAKRMPGAMVRRAGMGPAAQKPLETYYEEELLSMRRALRQEGRGQQ